MTKYDLYSVVPSNKDQTTSMLKHPVCLFFHQLRAQSDHEDAELHLIQRPVTVQVAFLHHLQELIIPELAKPEPGRVLLQAPERDLSCTEAPLSESMLELSREIIAKIEDMATVGKICGLVVRSGLWRRWVFI